MSKDNFDPKLWTPRSVEETQAIYRDWASTYDDDVLKSGYVTPMRIATALAKHAGLGMPVLDFGCGTGLSGQALIDAGFTTVDGTDINPEMLELAKGKAIYRKLWKSEPDEAPVDVGAYQTIIATGVVSLGAAPPETLDMLLNLLPSQGLLALSFNDPTLAHESYTSKLDGILEDGSASMIEREHGPHLPEKGMGSEVIVLRKA